MLHLRPFNLQVPWELKAKTLELEGSSQDFLNSEAIKSQLTATGLWPPLRFETVCVGVRSPVLAFSLQACCDASCLPRGRPGFCSEHQSRVEDEALAMERRLSRPVRPNRGTPGVLCSVGR